ncbi:hypothetical protein RIF29_40931 [Crotalaria pallida]|uniref:Cytochrome P450 n=1 Tax=Crotalaria pallida TaxID=3830 RepID=A0AAN9E408_CROPI
MMKTIYRNASLSADTNLSELMISLTSTIICRIAFGRSYSEDEGTERRRFHELLNEFQANIGSFFVSDYIPFMGWFDKLMGLHASLERNFKELDNFYQQVINDRINHKNSRQDAEEEVIVDVLLRLKKERSFSIDLTYNHIKAVIMVC